MSLYIIYLYVVTAMRTSEKPCYTLFWKLQEFTFMKIYSYSKTENGPKGTKTEDTVI